MPREQNDGADLLFILIAVGMIIMVGVGFNKVFTLLERILEVLS